MSGPEFVAAVKERLSRIESRVLELRDHLAQVTNGGDEGGHDSPELGDVVTGSEGVVDFAGHGVEDVEGSAHPVSVSAVAS